MGDITVKPFKPKPYLSRPSTSIHDAEWIARKLLPKDHMAFKVVTGVALGLASLALFKQLFGQDRDR